MKQMTPLFHRTVSGFLAIALLTGLSRPASAQDAPPTNYDEAKIPAYTLPDPLVTDGGKPVRNARQWTRQRRGELLETFATQMYGHVPAAPEGFHFRTIREETVYDGLGIRKTVRLYLDASEAHWFDVLVHLPAHAGKGQVPVFAGLNFNGNEDTIDGQERKRWPYEVILRAGFGVATAWRDSVEPDGKAFVQPGPGVIDEAGGVRAWYNPGGDWGAISAWAWGLERIADYLVCEPAVDRKHIAVIGHSRLGKTALWAGANDPRFALIVANCSGCCGAALSRRVIGESFYVIDTNFPHWFTRAFDAYKGYEERFPADQHELIALAAPRPVYVASATEDRWADPKGEWLSAWHAGRVYELFKEKGLSSGEMPYPAPDAETGSIVSDNDGRVGYHIRVGKHDILTPDWVAYIRFAARHFKHRLPSAWE